MALVDADYCFVVVDFGAAGESIDSNAFKNSIFGEKLEWNQLEIPGSRLFPLVDDVMMENGCHS
jgi:hypothetical protein